MYYHLQAGAIFWFAKHDAGMVPIGDAPNDR